VPCTAGAKVALAQQHVPSSASPAIEDQLEAAHASPLAAHVPPAATAATHGVRVTATNTALGVTSNGLWINWKECLEGYPDVKPRFHACGDQRFVRQEPVCEMSLHAFVRSAGCKAGSVHQVKLAQQLTCGHIVYQAGTYLHKVGHNSYVTLIVVIHPGSLNDAILPDVAAGACTAHTVAGGVHCFQ
jgi:hypothetical protein